MNPASPLQLGDHVEIIGPGYDQKPDCEKCNRGKRIQIVDILPGGLYAAESGPWYPASSLRKVEELQIGDHVEIIGNPCGLGKEDGAIGEEARIEYATPSGNYKLHDIRFIYPASSLRKLKPEEMSPAERGELAGRTVREAMQEFSDEIEKATDAIRDILAPLVDDRLSAIEERAGIQEKRIHAMGQRLAFVEAFQKEQIENALDPKTLPRTDLTLDAMITDGTLEVADFRKKDIKTQRKIIKQLEEDITTGCNGMTCAECMDEIESDGIRMAALDYAIRSLRMPDTDNDPEFAHRAADVLEEMREAMQK